MLRRDVFLEQHNLQPGLTLQHQCAVENNSDCWGFWGRPEARGRLSKIKNFGVFEKKPPPPPQAEVQGAKWGECLNCV